MIAAYLEKPLLPVLLGLVIVSTSGCVSKDMTDLEDYAAEVLSRKGGQIEPLPPIKPYERYLYQAEEAGLRDPFRSFFDVEPEIEKDQSVADADQQRYATEILTHNREELESFELDSLRMVGVLENADYMWGIVRDTEGVVHRVTVGNYLGRNYGKITNIQENRIDVREIIKDSQGRWEERAASLALAEQ
ncbi:MAG: pilus assembly protein PilP [Gammaproteobacteria bacterium]